MPKQKQFLSAKKKSSKTRKNEGPGTANEYLSRKGIPPNNATLFRAEFNLQVVGVDFEEAGEKWRAGDSAKSSRFFVRALDTYDAGLQKFPQSFDLAYNKARLQFEVAQQPSLIEHLPTDLIELLQTALDSHRLAMKINQHVPDLLFNTAQLLTSLAETMSDGKSPFDAHRNEALGLLQEALELFQRCLDVQEFKFTQAQDDAAQEAEGQSNLARVSLGTVNGTVSNNASEEEVWASIEEPITRNTLLETAIAQLYTLTAICSLGPSDSGLVWAEQYYRNQLQDKIFIYTKGTSCQDEASFAQCKFKCAISGAAFRNGRLDLATYQKELNDAFGSPHPKLSANPQSLCDIADAELTFNASIQASVQQVQSDGMAQLSNIRWKHITKALDSLTAASKLPDAPNLPRIHLRRGDCEMLRLCLGEVPLKYDLAIKSAPILLQNAGVYYRGAAAYGRRMGDASDEQKEAEVKEAIVLSLVGNSERLSSMLKSERDVVSSIVEEMRDEGLLGQESLQTVGTSFA